MSYYGCNRYLCSVIEEMRKQLSVLDTVNLSRYKNIMAMMIEEAQTHANNMEAALHDWDDLRRIREEMKELKKELKVLKKNKKKLKSNNKETFTESALECILHEED